jgi:hypothetical protein
LEVAQNLQTFETAKKTSLQTVLSEEKREFSVKKHLQQLILLTILMYRVFILTLFGLWNTLKE